MTKIQYLIAFKIDRSIRDSAISRILRSYHEGTLPKHVDPEHARIVAIRSATTAIASDIANKNPRGAPAQ